MVEIIFDLQLFDEPPDGGGGNFPGGGDNPGGGESGGGSSSSVSWSGATSITSATVTSGETYTSTNADENAVLISTTATVTLNNATVTKSGGTEASDNYSFYGINSAVMCMGGGTTSIIGGTVTTSGAGANGVFSYGANSGQTNATGDGTTVYIKDVTISTTAQGSGGIMTTYGGTTVAENLTITTEGGSSAPIRTDRGGGWVTVTGGSYTSNGIGSPAIYSTAEITVNDATLTSNQSEGVCIEGAGSISLTNCTLTANNTATNGNATFYDTIMIYQSQSGDASDGTSSFSMTGGTLNSQNGHVFHVTNTTAVINLDGVNINNSDSAGVLLSVCDDGWSGASNVATLNASNQTLSGDILVGSDSTLTLNLTGSTFTGNISGEISNAAGTSISNSVGTVNVTLDSDSKWYLTGDTYITDFSGNAANVISNGFTLYENGVALDGITNSEGDGVNIENSNNNTLISGSDYADTIDNTGSNVTINAGAGDDSIISEAENVSISCGDGNDSVGNYGASVSISGGTGNDLIANNNRGINTTIDGGAGNDSIYNFAANSTILGGAGVDSIVNEAENVSIVGGDDDDLISNDTLAVNSTIQGGAGADSIVNEAESLSIDGGDDDDYIFNESLATNSTILGGAGSDSIFNQAEKVTIDGGKDADEIINYGANVSINGDAGNDSISNHGSNVTIEAGDGDDEINNFGQNVIVNGGEGNDSIENDVSVATVDGGTGNDVIFNIGDSVSIEGGNGDDSITNTSANVTINAGAGDDQIISAGESITIDGGDGADTITNSAPNVSINGGAGDDSITNRGENVTIVASAGNDTISGVNSTTNIVATVTDSSVDGDNVILTTSDGTLTIIDGKDQTFNLNGTETVFTAEDTDTSLNLINPIDNTLLSGTDYADEIANYGENVTINAGAGDDFIANDSLGTKSIIDGGADNDTIANNGANSTIIGGDGDDSIVNVTENVSISGGDGNDSIVNFGASATINGGAGDDFILNDSLGTNSIIDGGAGNDFIYNSGENATIVASAGNDYISGVNSTTNIVATVTSSSIDGDNVILTTSDGTLTIIDGKDQTFLLNGTETVFTAEDTDTGLTINNTVNNTLISGSDYADSINNTGENVTINAGAGDDSIYNSYEGENASINAGTGNDYIYNSAANYASINAGADNDIITNYGTNATIDAGEGNDSINNSGENVTIDAGAGNDYVYNFGDSVTVDAGAGADTIRNGYSYSSLSTTYYYGNYASINGGAGDDSILNYGENVTIVASAGNDTISGVTSTTNIVATVSSSSVDGNNLVLTTSNGTLTIIDGKDQTFLLNGTETVFTAEDTDTGLTINNTVNNTLISGSDYADSINNTGENVTINAGAGNDSITNAGNNTSINGGAGHDSIINTGENVTVVASAGNDTLVGLTSNTNIVATVTNSLFYNNNVVLTTSDGNLTIIDGAGQTFNLNGEETVFSDNADTETSLAINNSVDNTLVTGTSGDDTITNSGENVTISSGEGNDSIVNTGENSSINAGDGNNYINTTFEYTRTGTPGTVGPSTDIIAGSGNDSLYVTRVDNSTFNLGDGDNAITLNHSYNNTLTTGAGNDIIQVQKGASVAVYSGDGNDYIIGTYAKSADDWTFGGRATIDAGAGNDFISTYYSNLASINGGAGNDSIYTNGENSTVDGGAGDDYIELTQTRKEDAESQVEAVLVLAGEGNDTLTGINTDTSVQGAFTSSSLSGDNVILTGENGTLNILNGAGTPFYINGEETVFGSVVLTNDAENTLVSGSKYADTINNTGDSVTVNTGAGEDLITNTGDTVTVYAGAGDDSITNSGNNAALSASTGDDSITNSGDNVSISGGAGKDVIDNTGSNVTINAGSGDNLIYNSGTNVVLIAGSGNDTLFGANSTTDIQGTFTNATVDGDNVVLTTSNGSVTIVDAKDATISINGEETVISEDPRQTLAAYIADFLLHKTAAGYPAMAAVAFHPNDPNPAAPTNYFSSETWTATSADNLTLSAVHYSPEEPTGRWVILVHGYGHDGGFMNGFAAPYLEQGVDVLIVDQRAAGNSEGEWLTMGVAESADLAIWTQEVAKKNANAQITLHGISMGAATVMLAAALSQTTNVTSIIEDCGYANITDVLSTLLNVYGSYFGLTEGIDEFVDTVMSFGEGLTGYDVAQAKAIDVIAQVTVPSLFIQGADDSIVPVSVTNELYNASGATTKDVLTIPNAGHAESAEVDSATYLEHAVALIEAADSEIGASITSAESDTLLRGTIYDDTINNSGANATVSGGKGNDSIRNTGDNTSIVGGAGNDTFVNLGHSATIDAGDGDNFIVAAYSSDTSILSGDGNDSIVVIEGANAYINAGEGDNLILNAYVYQDLNGNMVNNDVSDTTSTIITGSGNDSIANQGIYDSSILAGDGNNYVGIYQSTNNTIVTGSGDDTVMVSKGKELKISTGAGNDSIVGEMGRLEEDDWSFGDSATVDAGDGDDYISLHYSANSSIYGGAGNDTIINNGANTTINGGEGDDYISLTSNYYDTPTSVEPAVIVASAGNDTLVGLTSTTSILGAFTSATVDGDNVLLTSDEGTLTIIDGKDQILNINGAGSIIGGDYTKELLTVDGVLYILEDGAVLNRDSSGKVTGISGGTATAQIANAETSPKITLDGSTAFNFTASAADGLLKIDENGHTFNYTSGEMTYSADGVYFHSGEVGVKTTNETFAAILGTVIFTIPSGGISVPLNANETSINFSNGISATLSGGVASGGFSFTGGIAYDAENKQVTLSKDAVFSVKDLQIAEGMNALNFDITALEESVLAVASNGLLAQIAIKDGSSVYLAGKTFGVEGSFTLANGDITFGLLEMIASGSVSNLSITPGATVTMELKNLLPIAITSPSENGAQITRNGTELSLTTSDDNGLDIVLGELPEMSLNLKGTLKFDAANEKINFTFTDGTVSTFKLADGSVAKLTNNGDVSVEVTIDGDNIEFSPQADTGNLGISLSNSDGELIFDGKLDFSGGGITYNALTNHISVAAGAALKFSVDDYTFTTSNTENISGTFDFSKGITFTPDSDSGTISLTIGNESGNVYDGVVIEFKNGAFTVENVNNILIEKDTETIFKFSDDYSVAFKTTDDAGGQLKFVDGGISYTPNSGDGSLEMTVTNGDTVRTTSLEVTGSITYLLGGDITLAKGTVIENVFKDGVNLKITAKTDASGTISFQESEGLTVADENSNLELELSMPNGSVGKIDSITGKLTYQNAKVTLYEGTNVHMVIEGISEQILTVDSGTAILDYSEIINDPEISLISDSISDNGSLTIKTVNVDKATILNGGTFKSGTNIQLLTPGAIVYGAAGESGTGATTFSLDGDGEYTVNGFKVNVSNIDLHDKTHYGTAIRLIDNKAIAFTPGTATISYNDQDYTGDFTVYITEDATSYILFNKGTYTLDGKTFELTEASAEGVTISPIEGGYSVAHVVTQAEADSDDYNSKNSEVGLIYTENYTITDDSYSIILDSKGITNIKEISDASTIKADSNFSDGTPTKQTANVIVTDTEGEFTFADKTYTISGDPSVSLETFFNNSNSASLECIDDLTGTISGDFNALYKVNGNLVSIDGGADNVTVDAGSDTLRISGLADGAAVSVDSNKVYFEANNSFTLNDVTYTISGDSDGVLMNSDKLITKLDENASLRVSEAGTYSVNGTALNVTTDSVIIGMNDVYAYVLSDSQLNDNDSTAEILNAMGVAESDAVIISANVAESQQATLDDSGELAIVEATEDPVTIVGGKGNDTIVTKGADVTVDLANGGEDKIIAQGGNVKLENYDPTTNAGVQLTVDDMKIDGGKINNGKLEMSNATVDPGTNFVNLYDLNGDKHLTGFATSDEKVVDASAFTESAVLFGGGEAMVDSISGVSLLGGAGNDTFVGGAGAYIAPGKGKNDIGLNGGNSTVDYGGGNDYIMGFTFADSVGADKISNATVDNAAILGIDNIVSLSTGEGSIMIEKAKNKDIAIGDDTLQVGEDELKFDGVANKFIATGENASVTVAENYAGENPPAIALSDFEDNVNVVDASNYDGAASITGNANNNTLVASAGGSTINAGAGKNSIVGGDGADEFIANSGKNTISNFGFGAGENADIFNAEDSALVKAAAKGDDIILSFANGSAQIEDAAGQTLQIQNAYTNNKPVAAQFAKDSLTVNDEANFYYATGNSATVSVGAGLDSTNALAIDLTNADYNNAEKLSFSGDIKAVDASSFSGAASITGNDNNNVLTASAGGSTLNGGNGRNKLIGGDGADEFISTSGRDSIFGFNSGTDENSDKLNIGELEIKDVKVSGNDVTLETDGGSVKIEGVATQTIQLKNANDEITIAQFGKDSMTLNDEVDLYWITGKNVTISIADISANAVGIDLSTTEPSDEYERHSALNGDIKEIDGTGYQGRLNIVGDDKNNVFIGGNGSSTLWGGASTSNDTLIGGSGADTFIYGKNNGDDVVQGATSNDLVRLDGITLDDLKALGNDLFVGNDVKFELNDGGSLTVKDAKTSGVVMEVGGTKYAVNQSSGEWESRN